MIWKNVYLYDVDDLKGVSASNLRLRKKEIDQAEKIVEEAVFDYQSWLEQLNAGPRLKIRGISG